MKALEIRNKGAGSSSQPDLMTVLNFVKAAAQDYMAARCLTHVNPFLFVEKSAHNVAESLEKIMKVFLLNQKVITQQELKGLSHNLESIRMRCAQKDVFFEDPELKDFCVNYSNPHYGNEVLRYGPQEMTEGYGINMNTVILLADKFFFGTIIKANPAGYFAVSTDIASLLCSTPHSPHLKELLGNEVFEKMRGCIIDGNSHISEFIKLVDEFYIEGRGDL